MSTPADDLYELFTKWRSKGKNAYPVDSRSLKTDEGWKQMRYAARCLSALESVIDQMDKSGDDVTSERKYLDEWSKAVFNYSNNWGAVGHGVPDSAYNTLGMFRNTCKRFLPEAPPDFLDELRQLLADEPSMTPPPGVYPVELFDYFTRVRFHLKKCIDDYASTNTFDLMQAAEHYRAAVFMMANGRFVTNPADWGRHAARTFGMKFARKFGMSVYDEAHNELSRQTLRGLGNLTMKALEAGSGG